MSTWRLLLVTGLLAAIMAPVKAASAGPHDTGTAPHTICEINAFVWFGPDGIDTNPSDGRYAFVGTELHCEGLKGGIYDVFASGDTTDLWHDGIGEDCEQGGSVKIDDELHTGLLTAVGTEWDFEGVVHLARLGTTVLADGPLTVTDSTVKDPGGEHFFQAELEFVPTEGDCTKGSPTMEAALTGYAHIYDTDHPGYFHDCTLDDKNDPHCA